MVLREDIRSLIFFYSFILETNSECRCEDFEKRGIILNEINYHQDSKRLYYILLNNSNETRMEV